MFGMEDLPALDAPGALQAALPERRSRDPRRFRQAVHLPSESRGLVKYDSSSHVVQLHKFKILFVGDCSTGKSSVVQRITTRSWVSTTQATIGVDYVVKTMQCAETGDLIHLHLWDVGGHELSGYKTVTTVYYRHSHGAFVVFDRTRKKTFASVLLWKENIERINGDIPIILLANKADETAEADYNLEEFAQEHGFAAVFETSAREGTNVQKALETMAQLVLTGSDDVPVADPHVVDVCATPEPKKDGCC